MSWRGLAALSSRRHSLPVADDADGEGLALLKVGRLIELRFLLKAAREWFCEYEEAERVLRRCTVSTGGSDEVLIGEYSESGFLMYSLCHFTCLKKEDKFVRSFI